MCYLNDALADVSRAHVHTHGRRRAYVRPRKSAHTCARTRAKLVPSLDLAPPPFSLPLGLPDPPRSVLSSASAVSLSLSPSFLTLFYLYLLPVVGFRPRSVELRHVEITR